MIVIEERKLASPFFSVCVPQHNRTSFFLKCLESFRTQTLQDFELCISDGASTDGRSQEILGVLSAWGFSFCFARHEHNLQYDPNLRSSVSLAQGRYCLLFGNDDMLAHPTALEMIARYLEVHRFPEVAITNYGQIGTGAIFRRIQQTGVLGAGPHTAVSNFRNFSFVSGILIDR